MTTRRRARTERRHNEATENGQLCATRFKGSFPFHTLLLFSVVVISYFILHQIYSGKHDNSDRRHLPNSDISLSAVTNTVDEIIDHMLAAADDLLEKKRLSNARAKYESILSQYPDSPRANYGLAQTLCLQAENQRSNLLLEQCIKQYKKILDLPNVPKVLMLEVGKICADRMQFRGWRKEAIDVVKRLVDMFPDEVQLWNELGVQYLMSGLNAKAKEIFMKTLEFEPDNSFAKAHLGFIYKTSENDPNKAVPLLREALNSSDNSVQIGKFYLHLGEALQRQGNPSEAYMWYEKAESLGLFLSKDQRSLHNVDRLSARPWWTKKQTGQQKLIEMLEQNWKMIRDEGLSNIGQDGGFILEGENLRETGDWRQLTLFEKGRKNVQMCKLAPRTCALVEQFPDAVTCKRGQVKYSIMQPGVHVWPHCGPTNCRIRMHLGLVIPKHCCTIRVVNDTRTWKEGKVIVFDDSFEHEVWHNGTEARLVLIVDIWHPELTARERASLFPI